MNHGFSDDDDLEYRWGEMVVFTRKFPADSGEVLKRRQGGPGRDMSNGVQLVYRNPDETHRTLAAAAARTQVDGGSVRTRCLRSLFLCVWYRTRSKRISIRPCSV